MSPPETDKRDPNKVFISHVQEDHEIALQLAFGLEEAGYSTWCYEVDSIPGPSHMDQTLEAIEESDAVLMLISADSVKSHEVTTELTRAQDHHRPIIPLLLNITHGELMSRRSEWGQRLGSATCLTVGNDVALIIPRLIRGLEYFKVLSGRAHDARTKRLQVIEEELRHRGSQAPRPRTSEAGLQPSADPAALPVQAGEEPAEQVAQTGAKAIEFPGKARYQQAICELVKRVLEADKLQTQLLVDAQSRIVQGQQPLTQKWKKALRTTFGLESAVSVTVTAKGRDLAVTIGAGKWVDKALGGAIGVFVFWPAAFTAGWGFYKQKQLFTRIERDIRTFLSAKD
jgi:hypothetical protein